jgi:hypothetical protein
MEPISWMVIFYIMLALEVKNLCAGTYLVLCNHGYLCMVAGHDRAIKPGIVHSTEKSFADAFRGSADGDIRAVWG